MQRCLELAGQGAGNVSPNPMVGCVIVHQGEIIGEGFHQQYGHAHAEVNAIHSVKNKSLLSNSTMYVNLEPCAHYGKTPPCANLIVEHRIPNVVIGCVDTFSKVAGKGIEILKTSGCNVITGIMENECREINRRFFTFHEKKRPYIILKWAQTADGFIDIIRNETSLQQPVWISCPVSQTLVHRWRAYEDAILVGNRTALNDNPKLDVRHWFGKNPLRIVLDKNLCLPKNLSLFDGSSKTMVITEKNSSDRNNIEYHSFSFDENLISNLLHLLYEKNKVSLIIEGGAKTLQHFLNNDLADEIRVFTGNTTFHQGLKAPQIPSNFKSFFAKSIQNDVLQIYRRLP